MYVCMFWVWGFRRLDWDLGFRGLEEGFRV